MRSALYFLLYSSFSFPIFFLFSKISIEFKCSTELKLLACALVILNYIVNPVMLVKDSFIYVYFSSWYI
jgi:hypothetical protein